MHKPAYFEILRPQQWYKNLLIFLPIIFSQQIFDFEIFSKNIYGFLILCMVFGGTYIINDILDLKKDIVHKEKCKRPLSSGRITKNQAITYAILLLISAEVLAFFLDSSFFVVTTLMIILTVSYSFYFKNIFLVDIFFISINYVLRAVSGIFLIETSNGAMLSPWLIIGVFFVALLLSFGKRKSEIIFLEDSALKHRKVLKDYTNEFLNFSIGITAATILVSYSIYSMTGPPQINDWRLVLTIPVFFFILILYVNLMLKGEYKGKEFNYLLRKEKKLLGSLIVYLTMVFVLIYAIPGNYFN